MNKEPKPALPSLPSEIPAVRQRTIGDVKVNIREITTSEVDDGGAAARREYELQDQAAAKNPEPSDNSDEATPGPDSEPAE